MAHQLKTRTTFEPAKTIQPIFTRGNVAVSRDGRILVSCVEEDVLLSDLWNGGEEITRIEGVCIYVVLRDQKWEADQLV
jgi:U3 small nucleolar RNA-associated protein 13